jgi:hypothetical protein
MAALVNPINPDADTLSRSLQIAARTLGLQLRVLKGITEPDIETAFVTLAELRGSLVMHASSRMRNGSPHGRFATGCPRSSKRPRWPRQTGHKKKKRPSPACSKTARKLDE